MCVLVRVTAKKKKSQSRLAPLSCLSVERLTQKIYCISLQVLLVNRESEASFAGTVCSYPWIRMRGAYLHISVLRKERMLASGHSPALLGSLI